MSKHNDEIAVLKKLLKKAEDRAARAEAKCKKAEDALAEEKKAREAAEETVVMMAACLHFFEEVSDCCQEILQQLPPDIPEAELNRLRQALQGVQDDFCRLSKDHIIARLFKKGSEKIGRPKKDPKDVNALREDVKRAERNLKERQKDLNDAMAVNAEAAKKSAEAESASPAIQAAADIANTPDPQSPEFTRQDSPGRQVPNAKATAQTPANDGLKRPAVCPKCGQKALVFGTVFETQTRSIAARLNDIADFFKMKSQHGYCEACGEAFCVCSEHDVPVKPGREMGLSTVIAALELNAMGIPLHKIQHILFSEEDQLGKDTLGRNLHDWLMGPGSLLLNSMVHDLFRQHTLVMDETTMKILQSLGQGVCASPEEEKKRKKDYLGVQCSAPGVREQCIRYTYLGGRTNESIFAALNEAQPSVLVTDGYKSYASYCQGESLPIQQCCLAHLRRLILDALAIPAIKKFLFGEEADKAIEKAQAELEKGTPAFLLCSVLSAFSKIYGNEASLFQQLTESRGQFLERVKKSRQKYAKPLMKKVDIIMCELAKTLTVKKKSGAYEASDSVTQAGATVAYYMNRRKEFTVFLDDPEVPPDSNAVERAIRPLAVLRRATDFKQSQERTQSLCILLSLHETARACGIRDISGWLLKYGRDIYLHCAGRTLTQRIKAAGKYADVLDARLMSFTPDAADDFDFTPYKAWNYQE